MVRSCWRKIRIDAQRDTAAGTSWVFIAIAVSCVSAVAAALVSQHYFDMPPCPWCVLQRAIFLMIAFVCVLALVGRKQMVRLGLCILALLLSLSGIAAAIWQHFWAASSFSCNRSLAEKIISGLGLDRLAPALMAPQTSCADGAVDLLGVPYEFWSLVLYLVITGALSVMVASLLGLDPKAMRD
jgi:protein dithiol:quinone oxidoreductase